uniref:Monocarboxylate transporter 5-like n=1 Tax=Phallusia mammillata TaxID=59560 RepID=A0A6F9DRN6_9ASCI|nr:monocarboxylate transporter 5-like [Phallusia mammillata]
MDESDRLVSDGSSPENTDVNDNQMSTEESPDNAKIQAEETKIQSTKQDGIDTSALEPPSSPLPTIEITACDDGGSNHDLNGSTVRFQSGICPLRERDHPSMSRELLSSPTASHMALGFGSLDIIMEGDHTRVDGNEQFPDPPRWGWVVVIASWIVMIPVAGVLASFGTLVSSLTQEFNATKLEAGWIGSLAFGFTVGTCPFSTPLFTVYGARKVGFVGVLGATISLVITSFIPILYLMFLTYSAMLGVFANFIYNTAMNLTGQYFPNKHQALATCLASAGVSFGTLLVNPLANVLVQTVGWRNTMRVMSGLVFVIGLACVACFKPVKTEEQKAKTMKRKKKGSDPTEPSENLIDKIGSNPRVNLEVADAMHNNYTGSKISLAAQEIKKNVLNKGVWDCSICANPTFILWMLGTLFWSVSFLFPFIFLIDYMESIGIERSATAWVMTAYGIAEFGGRLLCATVAGKIKFSLAYVYAGSAAFVGAATMLAPQGKSLGVMYVYAIAAGINAGILNSLMFVTTMHLFGNDSGKHVWGYINVMLALGMVVGPVAAGGIYDATNSYVSAFYMGGSLFLVCAIIMMLIPVAKNHFPRTEAEAKPVREKAKPTSNGHSNGEPKSTGSIVKPGSLRRLAHQQRAMKSSKYNGDVEVHLQALEEFDDQV